MSITGPLPDNITRLMSPEERAKRGIMSNAEITARNIAISEKKLQEDAYAYLSQHRGLTIGKNRMDRKTSYTVGWPDMVFCYRGHACALEFKVDSNTTSKEQDECIAGMTRDGWKVAIVRSLPEVQAFLNSMDNL